MNERKVPWPMWAREGLTMCLWLTAMAVSVLAVSYWLIMQMTRSLQIYEEIISQRAGQM